ncbi:50S ribosomal protein L34 [Candidatus Peregrinibacteria bacterium]|nr:MAG: 50S ribosomal protein L34 [Candidatus Peregrinibacteria bacterium]
MLSKGNKRKRHRRHGFLHRMSTPGGKNVIKRRRSKGRWELAVKKTFYGSWK